MTIELLTYKEAMEYLNIKSPATFRKLIKSGLPIVEINGIKRINKFEINKFIEEHQTVHS